MSDSNSANTAILAIFVIVILALAGIFVFRGGGGEKVELKVDIPQLEQSK